MGSAVGVYFLWQKNYTVSFQSVDLTPTTDILDNPYQGWYYSHQYVLDDEELSASKVSADIAEDGDMRLAQLKLCLSNYSQGELSDEALAQLETILSTWASSDKALLLYFYYDEAPEDITTVYLHMEQVAGIVSDYSSSIYVLQGSFVECESYLTEEGEAAVELYDLISYMYSLFTGDFYFSVATVDDYYAGSAAKYLPTVDDAFGTSLASRLSIYASAISLDLDKNEANNLSQLCTYVPSGGAMDPLGGMELFTSALEVLQNRMVSYLCADELKAGVSVEAEEAAEIEAELDEDAVAITDATDADTVIELDLTDDAELTEVTDSLAAAILASWQANLYQENDSYNGLSQFDYVSAHLGYRYVITGYDLLFDNWTDEEATLVLKLTNEGFSPAYKRFGLTLILRNTITEEVITLALDEDNRFWAPGEEVDIACSIPIKTMTKGDYKVYLMLMDNDTGELIEFGNSFESSNNGYFIGILNLE